jgi:large subunit ribosomal protein L3
MINAIYGKKIGMTQLFDENDHVMAVTVIQAEPNTVCQVKTAETDGYDAVQLAFGEIKDKRVTNPMRGHYAKYGVEPCRHLREVRMDDASGYKPGDKMTVAEFAEVKKVDVTGISKGKGYQGVIRRHGFGGGPGGHGSHFHRAPGSIGQCATPSRVLKGVRLPGHMGCDRVTVRNLEVVRVDEDLNIILVKGAVPGGKNGIVRVRMAGDGQS